MGSIGKEGESEEPKEDVKNEKKENEEEEKNESEKRLERRTGQLAGKQISKLDQTAQVVKLITLAASIAVTKAEDEERGEAESIPFEISMIYIICVVFLTLMLQKHWNAGVLGAILVAQLGSHTKATEGREGGETSKGEGSAEDFDPSIAKRPIGLSRPEHEHQAASASSSSQGDQHPSTGASPSGDTCNALRPMQGQDQSAASSKQTPMTLHARDDSPLDQSDEWDEIERLERAELTRATELIDLPFEVYTTKPGSVCHSNLRCRYLTAPETGVTRTAIWCSSCRREANKKMKIPKKGHAVFIDGWGTMAHTDPTCERADRCSTFACCTACL